MTPTIADLKAQADATAAALNTLQQMIAAFAAAAQTKPTPTKPSLQFNQAGNGQFIPLI